MPTISPEEEAKLAVAMRDIISSKFPTVASASRFHRVDYDLLRARMRGRLGNHTRGGQNKTLFEDQDAALKLYCERCILLGFPPERRHIKAAANSI
jgi:hypothetical protein